MQCSGKELLLEYVDDNLEPIACIKGFQAVELSVVVIDSWHVRA